MSAPIQHVSATLAEVLAAGRPYFNARVAEAKHHHPNLDTDAFAAFLRTGVDSVVGSVAAVAPEMTTSVAMAAFDIALQLLSQGLAGPHARSDLVDRVWADLAPRYARLVAAEATEVLGALSNAVIHIANVPNARVDDWLAGMALLAEHADSSATLRLFGQVMAWRAGLAHFRDGALRGADSLPEPVALIALGADSASNWAEIREAYRANRWWSTQAERRAAACTGIEVGQFTGFGGTFSQPPEVRADGQGFFVRSADRFSLLIADAYGAVLLPATAQEFAKAAVAPNLPVSLVGVSIVIGDRRIELGLPVDGLAVAANEHTIAVTSPYTHSIRLLSRS